MSEEQHPEDLFKKTLIFMRDHWALVASLGYFYLSIMGMAQAYYFYHSFGVNVFEYSELNDFALAGFKEPKTLFYGLSMVAYLAIVLLIAQRLFKRRPSLNASRMLKLQFRMMSIMVIPALILLPFFLPNMVNDHYSESWKDKYLTKPNNQAKIKLRSASIHNLPGGDIDNLAILGTTDKYYFFFNRSINKVLIIPISNILYVQHG